MKPSAASPSTTLDLRGVRSAFLIGIEGVGMSGVARLLSAREIGVAGSDREPGVRSAALASLGIAVGPDEDAGLPDDTDVVVHSAAIPPAHPQIQEARRRGLPTWKYAELLGALMADRFAICVAGSHGKTSTSSLIASGLVHAGRDPTFVVGGELLEWKVGARAGTGEHFVAESCEFDRSFHAHRPRVAVVTNVDEDHLDYYRDLAEIQDAFRQFAALLPPDGLLVVNDAYAPVFPPADVPAPVVTYGFDAGAHWHGRDVRLAPGGDGTEFELDRRGEPLGALRIPMLGRHNVLNAIATAAALDAAGLSFDEIAAGLAAFRGVGRRLEQVAARGGVLVFDDYGHHPVEIRAVVRALRKRYADRRLVVIFQPHQASRTRCLMKEFAAALAEADEVWLPPIYFARDSEEECRRVTSEDLAAHVRNEGGNAETLPDLDAVVAYGAPRLCAGDVVVTMGAGNVDEVARGLSRRLP